MKTSILFRQYIWIINKIYHSNGITLADINKEWVKTDMSDGIEFNRNTFRRHLNDIEYMFGLIVETGKGYRYYIKNSSVLNEDSVQNWLLSTLSVNNIITESMSIQNRIFMESIPEVSHLEKLVESMKENLRVVISYKKYGSTESSERVIEPYFLKLHKRRWYIMANTKDGHRLFSFDRIGKVVITEEKYRIPDDFTPKDYFEDCFGVMRDERKPSQRIVLRALGNEKHYMEDLPVHQSQKRIGEGDGYVDYEIFMRPTSDFIGYILSRGTWLKVLSPQSLIDEVKLMHQKAAEMYS